MAATAGNRLNLWENGQMPSSQKKTNQTESNLNRNVHWMVLYKVEVFRSDMKFKIAATQGLSFKTLLLLNHLDN